MKISILSIGKFDKSFYQDAYLFYQKRMKWKIELKEIESKSSKNFEENKIKEIEANLLKKHFENYQKIIVLDENGKEFSSNHFAKTLDLMSTKGESNIAFVIGGAFGLSQEIKDRADILMSLSKFTFPHLMVRILLIEQLYRASTIISNHPYHKN